ncbi:MAG: c-type cytochrome [Gemmataceae bacterium]|nr:c-type cytochrome [Gemmataceae bacterium]
MLLLLSLFAAAPPGICTVDLHGQRFTLPAGCSISLATKPGLVVRPIHAAFDGPHRLYVTEASGTNDPVAKQLIDRPHRLLLLEDADGDGVFDKRTVVADKLMLPQGVMVKDGAVYVACPPSIWKFKDGKREEWFKGKTLTGCANDLHGPWAGPDGWIYWTKGAFAEQRYPRAGKPDFVTRASHLFRARPDGAGIEAVMTGGMDNPVGLAFLPSGERFVSCTFLQHPAGGLRDGIIHAVHGGVYGKDHNVIDGHLRTSPALMPVMTHLGAAAPCGLIRYGSSALGEEYRGNLFCCLFNMRKVTRHALNLKGATFSTSDTDFLVSDSPDFHPTDVVEDAEGGLIVIDTGGWYKLCCPTAQLAKPEVTGAIYRVRKKGAKPAKRAARAEDAVWASCRREGEEARAEVRRHLEGKDEAARLAAIHAAGLWRDAKAAEALQRMVFDARDPSRVSDPRTLRAAAEALGRIGGPGSDLCLLMALARLEEKAETPCPILKHSLLHALLEIGWTKDVSIVDSYLGLAEKHPGLMLVKEQLRPDPSHRNALAVLRLVDGPHRETAWWIAARHPEWGETVAKKFADRLDRSEVLSRLPLFAGSAAVRKMMAEQLKKKGDAKRLAILEAMAAARLKELPEEWAAPINAVLAEGADKLASAALAIPASPATREARAKLAGDARRPALLRLRAGGTFDLALASLKVDDVPTRAEAVRVLASMPLSGVQLSKLAAALPSVGSMELGRLLEAFVKSRDEAVGLALVEAVRKSPVRSALTADQLRRAVAEQGAKVKKEAEAVALLIDAGAARQKEELQALHSSLGKGDPKRGHLVFNGPKAACASCHAIGYLGGRVGPDLTRIGAIRTERDLLEAIVFPSASFVRSYEPVRVRTVRGRVIEGIVKQETATHVVLALGATEEARIARKDIEEMVPGKVSIMPAGIDKVLTKRELADLVAFLRERKR